MAKRKRVDLPPAEKLKLLEEFKTSQLSAQAFAISKGIRPGNFHRWVKGEGLGKAGTPAAETQPTVTATTTAVAVPPLSRRGRPKNGHAVTARGEVTPPMRLSPMQQLKAQNERLFYQLGRLHFSIAEGHFANMLPED